MRAFLTRSMPLVLIALLVGLIWLLNRATLLPADMHEPSPNLPDLVVKNAQARRFDLQGNLVTQLTATAAQHLPQDDTMLFENIRLEQSRPGEPKMTVTGESAKTIHRAEEVWLYGKVEMHRAADKTNPELVIRTRDMHVNTETQVARSSAPMTAEMGPQSAQAVGFVADNRNETLELLSQVRITYVPKKSADSAPSRLLP